MRVLERIVTDRGYDVATQIEALRDQRSVEATDSGTPLDMKQGEHVMDWGGPNSSSRSSPSAPSAGSSTTGSAPSTATLEDEWGGKTERSDTAETKALKAENAMLHDKVDTMQDRMVVLEKIVTDRGYSLSDEIEALRDEAGKRAACP